MLICPHHQRFKQMEILARIGLKTSRQYLVDIGIGSFNGSLINRPSGSIQRDVITFSHNDLFSTTRFDDERALFIIHRYIRSAADTYLTQLTSNKCCVGGHAPSSCENTLRSKHAFEIVWRRFGTTQHDFFATVGRTTRRIGREHNFPRRRTRASRKSVSNGFVSPQRLRIENRYQQGINRFCGYL